MRQGSYETALGSLILTNAFWLNLVSSLYPYISFIAVTCGAILGVHGVWRLLTQNRKKKDEKSININIELPPGTSDGT